MDTATTPPASSRKPRTARPRTLTGREEALRPSDIHRAYGIAPSTLHFYCVALPAKDRLPSIKLPGRKSRTATNKTKGVRIILKRDLDTWLEKYRTQ